MRRGGDSGGGRGSGSWECLTLLLYQTSSAGLLGSTKEGSRQELTMEPSGPGEELKGSFAKALALTPLRDKHSPPPSWSP